MACYIYYSLNTLSCNNRTMLNMANTYEQAAVIWTEFAAPIARLESRRKNIFRFTAALFLCTIVLCLISLLQSSPDRDNIKYILVAICIGTVISAYALRVFRRGLWLSYKPLSHLIVRRILGAAYKPFGIIPAEDLDDHGILPRHSRLYREEGYSANLHGYRIRFQEIDAVHSFDSMSVREWRETSVSSGLYVLIEMRRDLPAHTILVSRRNRHTFVKSFLRHHFGDYKPVGLVSPRFKDKFEVFSTDQVEARVAFHPAFMEKFMEIADRLDAVAIEASFKQNKLLIHARYKKDLFQLGSLRNPLTVYDIERLIQELKLYEDILSILRLNPYTAP